MGAAGRETQFGLVPFLSWKPYLLLCAKSCESLQLSQKTVSLGKLGFATSEEGILGL